MQARRQIKANRLMPPTDTALDAKSHAAAAGSIKHVQRSEGRQTDRQTHRERERDREREVAV